MNKDSKIYVAGHRGMVGSAIVRLLQKEGFENLLVRRSSELDLRNQEAVNAFFREEQPEYVYLAAAKVGGIHANNQFKADFIYDNLMMECNVIHAAHENGCKKLLFLGSSCIYPKFAEQPIQEESLLTGLLEPTNEPYALAKIAGLKMCDYYREQYGADFISLMPTNLYGPNDNYDLQNSHVIPAMLRKFHEAKMENKSAVELWGTGSPKREFLHVDDLAKACVYFMQTHSGQGTINIGTGEDITIKDLAYLVKEVVDFQGEIYFNTDMPDGTPRKLLDVSKLKELGWTYKTSLKEGIQKTYLDYVSK